MSTKKTGTGPTGDEATNLVCLTGTVRVEPTIRSGPDETLLMTFDIVTTDGSTRRTVPISWEGTARSRPTVGEGMTITVLGTVQRRFFRVGGATAHTVDVRAERLARTSAARRRLMAAASERLGPNA